MIYSLGNNIHIHMKIYSFRIRLETYKLINYRINKKTKISLRWNIDN